MADRSHLHATGAISSAAGQNSIAGILRIIVRAKSRRRRVRVRSWASQRMLWRKISCSSISLSSSGMSLTLSPFHYRSSWRRLRLFCQTVIKNDPTNDPAVAQAQWLQSITSPPAAQGAASSGLASNSATTLGHLASSSLARSIGRCRLRRRLQTRRELQPTRIPSAVARPRVSIATPSPPVLRSRRTSASRIRSSRSSSASGRRWGKALLCLRLYWQRNLHPLQQDAQRAGGGIVAFACGRA